VANPDPLRYRGRQEQLMPTERLPSILDNLAARLAAEPGVAFALLHGSVLRGEVFRDIDVAVFFSLADRIAAERAALDLEVRLQDLSLPAPVEVQPLDTASVVFRHRVLSEGLVLYTRPADGALALADLTEHTIHEYLDTEHLRRIISTGLRAA
jgi:predicted nucleotidyltransferase